MKKTISIIVIIILIIIAIMLIDEFKSNSSDDFDVPVVDENPDYEEPSVPINPSYPSPGPSYPLNPDNDKNLIILSHKKIVF